MGWRGQRGTLDRRARSRGPSEMPKCGGSRGREYSARAERFCSPALPASISESFSNTKGCVFSAVAWTCDAAVIASSQVRLAVRRTETAANPTVMEPISCHVVDNRNSFLNQTTRLDDQFPWDYFAFTFGISWLTNPSFRFLWRFIPERVDAGERVSFGDRLGGIAAQQSAFLLSLLENLGADLIQPLIDELQGRRHLAFDAGFLNTVGRAWGPGRDAPQIFPHGDMVEKAEAVRSLVCGEAPRPVLLVGDHGVGKTSLVRMLADRLQADNWHLRVKPADTVDSLCCSQNRRSGRARVGALRLSAQCRRQQLSGLFSNAEGCFFSAVAWICGATAIAPSRAAPGLNPPADNRCCGDEVRTPRCGSDA